MDGAQRLIGGPVDEDGEVRWAAGPSRRYGALRVAGAVACAVAAAGALSGRSADLPMAVKSLLYGRTHDVERLVSVYKRTYFSTDPFHDGEFLQNILGMNVITSQLVSRPAVNGSSGDGTSTCAKREVLTTLDNFQLHFFHSFMYPGHESSNRWVQAWSEEHENLSKERWDVFSAPSLTFLLINIPYSGLTIEVVSDEDLVTSKTVDHNTFEAMIERMCPYSLMVHQDPRTLRKVHEKLGGLSANSHGLPDLLMVSMAFPTTVPARFAHFFESVLGTLGIFPVGEQFESATCKTWEVELASTMKLNGSLVVNPVYMKAVANLGARPGPGNYTLTNLEHEVNGTHHKYMDSPNSGWDSWIDMHPGLHVNTLLDGAPEAMRKNGFQYTMHPSCVGCNAGSMWSSGITPWSMEIQGAFSKDDEIRKQSLIDYCSPTSNGDTRININEIRDGLVG
ncbi:hypothetical protein JL721_8485 [Aureococcus anophagefferens]|nr:hypothetical protein JL722_14532 [Aureococcus anophagefferens]KAH8064080.1 hypothetical protein JL721_8485 [Aureococcus anophagefferens]